MKTSTDQLTVGRTVKYSRPSDGERDIRFTLLWADRGVASIQLIDERFSIRPIETVAVDEIEAAN